MKWRGVNWWPVRSGACTGCGTKVPSGSACVVCHRAQLAASARGSHEWEIQTLRGAEKQAREAGAVALSE